MSIIICTGGISHSYEVIDIIFAADSHKEGFLTSADPNKAFDGVKMQLAQKCEQLGGHAVINCQFEYRNALGDGLIGKKQVIEIFAYGTVVRLTDAH